jgi:diguanylate cyclase (GGDEF)-like protein
MEQSARLADRNNELMAVIFVDLDLFTEVKASLGQALADDLLKEAAARLTAALRESDTVCRLGRDEFVIMLPGVKSLDQVEAVADKILQEIAKPCLLGEHTIKTSCSLGISIYPHDATDTGTLMRLSDQAMAYAKKSGRNRYVFASADAARITLIPIVPSYNE